MTERAEKALKRASTIIALSLTVVSIIVGGYRVVDTSNRAIALAEVVQARIEIEKAERQSADAVLDKAIVAERENRNSEYAQIQVKLTEIDTHLVYIRKALDGGR